MSAMWALPRVMPALRALLLLLLPATTVALRTLSEDFRDDLPANRPAQALLFAYFQVGKAGLHLASSFNGWKFTPFNDDEPIFTAPAWEDQDKFRDPSIVFHEGTFHMVWTSAWQGRVFGYCNSTNLVNWSEPVMVKPFPKWLPEEDQPLNVWAPEIHFDSQRGDFFVLFSSTTPRQQRKGGRTPPDLNLRSEGNITYDAFHEGLDQAFADSLDHRTYIVRGKGGQFSSARRFMDLGFSVIDAAMVSAGDRWVMVFKNEMGGQKNFRLAFAEKGHWDLEQPFPPNLTLQEGIVLGLGAPLRGEEPAEGPTLVHYNGRWLLYGDAFTRQHYTLVTSPDLHGWTDETESLVMPPRMHHGTAFVAPSRNVGWFSS